MLETTTGLSDRQVSSVVVAEPDAKFVVVPDAALLFTADYKRSGPDLVLTGQDGRHTVVQDYFKTDNPLKLMAPNGAGLPADVVDLLANAHSHHQYAQTGDAPPPPAPIATVKALLGSASAMRNGAEVTLKIGDPIYKSDIIQTASGSSVGITFPDGTALHITANARMALSDYSFDANSTTNGAFFHLIDGTFSFVAGQVARTGGLKIETPVGTVGIRGTTGWVQQVATISATVGNTTYSFAVTEDQGTFHTSTYEVVDEAGNVFVVSQKGLVTLMTGQGVGQPALVTTEAMTAEQLAFEQQIIQAVFNVATGLTPRFDPGHDGSYPSPPYEQHNELPGDYTTTFAFTLPDVDDKEVVVLAKVVWTPPVLPVFQAAPVEVTSGGGPNIWRSPVGGDWTIGGNWTEGVPGPPQVVIIDLPRGETVHYDGGGTRVSTTIAELQNLGRGTLDVSHKATLKVQGPATNEGKIEATDHGKVSFKFGQVDNKECAVIEAGGRGSVVDFSSSLVRNAGLIAAFSHGLVTFDHVALNNTFDGVIKADGWGSEIDFNHTLITSAGLIEARHDGLVTFDRVFLHNGADGIIEAQGRGSEIDFSHSYVANGGLIEAKSGGVVSFHGGTVDNAHHGANDGAIEAIGRGSVVELCDTHVIGGTLQTSGHGVIEVESSGTMFDGSHTDSYGCVMAVTVDGHVLIDENSDLTLLGTIHNHGLIEVDASGGAASQLVIEGSVTLDGCGYVKFDGSSDSIIGSCGSDNVLENVNNTIYGAGSIGDGNSLKLLNESDGVVDANVRHGTLTIDTGWHQIVNSGLLEATHGGSLVIDSNVDNSCGLVEADARSYVSVIGDIYHGDALIDGGTLEYDGCSNVDTAFACNSAGTLVLGADSHFTGKVIGFDADDRIDFKSLGFTNCTQVTYCDGTLTVTSGSESSHVQLCGDYSDTSFVVFDDGCGNAEVATAPQANDDHVIASYSALDECSTLTLPSEVLLSNDSDAIRGDTLAVDHASSGDNTCVSGPDCEGNIAVKFDNAGDGGNFSYTTKDSYCLNSSASVDVSFQCGSLEGTCGNEIILPGSQSACLTGGGGNDTFLFANNVATGNYNVTDFTTHSQGGGGADVIDLENFSNICDFHDVLCNAQDVGCNTVIDLGCNNSITLQNVHISDLSSADFAIHHAAVAAAG
jgi:hypothetical protein